MKSELQTGTVWIIFGTGKKDRKRGGSERGGVEWRYREVTSVIRRSDLRQYH